MIVPELLVMGNPVAHRTKPFWNEAVAAFAAMPLFSHQTGIEQDTKVLRHGRTAHFEVGSNVVDRALGFIEQIQHLASPAMAYRYEHIGLGIGIGLSIGRHDHTVIISKRLLTRQG